jgi:hypothetical protein
MASLERGAGCPRMGWSGRAPAIRAFLLERGVAVRQGLRFLRVELPGILATRTDVLSPRMSRVIEELAGDGSTWMHASKTSQARLKHSLARISTASG